MTVPLLAAQSNAEQRAAEQAPLAGGTLAITGSAGTGKTFALVRRAIALAARAETTVLVTAPSGAGVTRLCELLREERAGANVACVTFGASALALLREAEPTRELEEIDEVRASHHFERVGAELFALEWTELARAEIDPEITGLRTPERFAAAAFRLIRKLRAALVSPGDFRAFGLRGATAFYGNPPNFASAELILDTPAKYRDSLRVSPSELERQRTREVDLVKILTRLYATYVEKLVAHGCLTATDAVYEAALLLRATPALRSRSAARYAAILIDDAQDLTPGQLAFARGLAAEDGSNLTLAGDAAQSTRGFATGARGSDELKGAPRNIDLREAYGGEPGRALLAESGVNETVSLYRAATMREEAQYVASEITKRIAAGTPPGEIAVIARNLRCAHTYIDALLARDVPVDASGAASLYDFPAARDALAALWSAVDPFRHDYLLRALQAPWMRLCDATLATLCADATIPQPLLFEVEGDDSGEARAGRWDRRRDLRLGRNVTRGDVDTDLPAEARERLQAFRDARERYERAARELEPPELARLILDETVLATAPESARGRFTRGIVSRLLTEIDEFFARDPLGSLEDYLTFAELVAACEDDLLTLAPEATGCVRVLDVEAAKGETFRAVFAVDVRAGAWPRYYVPEAFLFVPSFGMMPKENVGDARAARTAKFTYGSYRYKLRQKYNAEERRALHCALTRARDFVSVSASGRATRGASTPELFEELHAKL